MCCNNLFGMLERVVIKSSQQTSGLRSLFEVCHHCQDRQDAKGLVVFNNTRAYTVAGLQKQPVQLAYLVQQHHHVNLRKALLQRRLHLRLTDSLPLQAATVGSHQRAGNCNPAGELHASCRVTTVFVGCGAGGFRSNLQHLRHLPVAA